MYHVNTVGTQSASKPGPRVDFPPLILKVVFFDSKHKCSANLDEKARSVVASVGMNMYLDQEPPDQGT